MDEVAGPIFIPQMGRKRDPYYQRAPVQSQPQRRDEWSSKMWDWDCSRFQAKPVEAEIRFDLDSQEKGLDLNLASCVEDTTTAATTTRPSKRVRAGSPGGGGGSYPMCQVDNCSFDLSHAKDYHRRHKVCEAHSKATKALVGKQMQRFCQQCSR